MPRILDDTFTVPADTTPAYSEWAEVGFATSVDAGVMVTNDYSPDLWIQWTDDPTGPGPEPEDVDVFMPMQNPHSNLNNYYVGANGLTPAGSHIRIKGVADGFTANCHAIIDAD